MSGVGALVCPFCDGRAGPGVRPQRTRAQARAPAPQRLCCGLL